MKPITRNRFQAADQVRNRWAISPEEGSTVDDVMRPEATAHIAAQLKRWDIIEVRPDDESFYAELLVKDAGPNWASFWLIQHVELAPKVDAAEADEPFVVGWGGPHQKHRVTRKADNEVLKSGFPSKAEARAWAIEHTKAMA